MIVSKPKTSTLFSLSVFLLLTFGLVGYQFLEFKGAWYQYLLIGILAPMGLFVLIKLLWGYKIVKIAKGKFDIRYPFRLKHLQLDLKQLVQWKQVVIETRSNDYKEIQLEFEGNHSLSMSLQEYEAYDKVYNYLKQKSPKKEVRE